MGSQKTWPHDAGHCCRCFGGQCDLAASQAAIAVVVLVVSLAVIYSFIVIKQFFLGDCFSPKYE